MPGKGPEAAVRVGGRARAGAAGPAGEGGDTQPLAAVGHGRRDPPHRARRNGGGDAADRGDARGGERRHRRRRSHRRKREQRVPGWVFGAAGILLFLGIAAAALRSAQIPLRPRVEARAAAREAAETALPPETPAKLVAAWSDLVAAIGSAQATGRLDDEAAEDLGKAAQDVLEAYRDADAVELGIALGDLEEELAKAVEEEEVSAGAADAIDQEMSDLESALEDEGALAVVEPSLVEETDTGSPDESSGSGGEGNGDAYGHDKDNEGKGNGGLIRSSASDAPS